jgi:predicted DNA-binding transcriptional regulator
MVSKDQAIGGLIFIVCAVVGILYAVTLFYPQWLSVFGVQVTWLSNAQFWVIAVPVLIAFIAIMAIGAWIGWTMATTPPPKPIEEITSEMETEQKTVTEEKPIPEEKPVTEEKPAEQPKKEEEKKPERKRKIE